MFVDADTPIAGASRMLSATKFTAGSGLDPVYMESRRDESIGK